VPDPTVPVWERRYRAPAPTFPTWSSAAPDRLAFASNEGGSYQAYGYDRATGERTRLSDSRVGVVDAFPSADGAEVVWFEDDTGDESGSWVAAPFGGGNVRSFAAGLEGRWPAGIALGRSVVVVATSDRGGYAVHALPASGGIRELFASENPVNVGGTTRQRGGFVLGGLSPDERLVCLEHSDRGDEVRRAVRVVEVASGDVVGDEWDGEGLGLDAVAWSPRPGDARLLLRHEREDRYRPELWDLARGERTEVRIELPGDVIPLDWFPDASALLVAHHFEGRDELFRVPLPAGAPQRIEHPAGALDDARVRPDGEVWLQLSSGGTPARVLSDAGQEVLPAHERAPHGAAFTSWSFPNRSGDTVHGFYVAPPGAGPFPAVMLIHGGPTWHVSDRWEPDAQAFVDHGFVVGMVNYRGSTGYGRAWRDHVVGNIGLPEEEDVLCGLDDLVGRGLADPGRAVSAGWSWGGYITLLTIGRHPQRWRAAVGGVPVGDYAAGYEDLSPDLQAYDRYLLGGKSPHDVPDLMAERNPIVYVDSVRTPTLVLVGRNDSRCPYGQAMAWVDAVRARGGEVEVYEYDTGHSSFDVDEVVRQMRVVFEFLTRRV
jgi:dipeptidyl aminopeptidase/acylaminoacyl peptidase